MKSGFYRNLSFEEYCAIDALNASSLHNLRRSPLYYRYFLDHPSPSTPEQNLGIATHKLILEPKKLGDFATWGLEEDQKVRRGKVWDEFQRENKGKHIITCQEFAVMCGIQRAVYNCDAAGKYLTAAGDTEVTMVWEHAGRTFKARLDKLSSPLEHIIIDLKTTRSCVPWRFASQSYQLGYHIKAAMYMWGYKILTGKDAKFRIIAVESKPPHECAVYRITPDIYAQGMADLETILDLLGVCEKNNLWPAFTPGETDLVLPAYASTESLEEFAEVEA